MVSLALGVKFNPNAAGLLDFQYLSVVPGYSTPASQLTNGKQYRYRAELPDLSQWEWGTGTWTAATTTLSRTTIQASSAGGAKVSFSATPQIGIVIFPADIANLLEDNTFTGTNIFSGTVNLSGLTASTALALDASKNVVSVANTGSGNNVLQTSPALAGVPTAPTAAALNNSTQLSTTAYADGAVSTLSSTVTADLALKAPLASPTFTGTVTEPNLIVSTSATFSNLTSGSVLYAGTGGLLSQDNANLFYDSTNKTFGLGANNPFTQNAANGGGQGGALIRYDQNATTLFNVANHSTATNATAQINVSLGPTTGANLTFLLANFSGGAVLTHGTITGGSLYTTGTYTNVPLTGGTGAGVLATVVVAAGAVTTVTITTGGKGYLVADVLSANAADIGGTGSGFSVPVATASAWGAQAAIVGDSVVSSIAIATPQLAVLDPTETTLFMSVTGTTTTFLGSSFNTLTLNSASTVGTGIEFQGIGAGSIPMTMYSGANGSGFAGFLVLQENTGNSNLLTINAASPWGTTLKGALSLGVSGSVVGSLTLLNATSGSITIQPPTGALGSAVLTLPDITGTILATAAAGTAGQVLTSNGAAAPTFQAIKHYYQMHTLTASSQAQNTTGFAGNELQSTASAVYFNTPVAGTFKNLFVATPGGPGGAAQTFTFTLYVTGATTALTCTQTTGANTSSDTTHSVAVNAGDTWSLQCVTSATSGSLSNVVWSVEFDV